MSRSQPVALHIDGLAAALVQAAHELFMDKHASLVHVSHFRPYWPLTGVHRPFAEK